MGRLNSTRERLSTLKWAKKFKLLNRPINTTITLKSLRELYKSELKNYFALAALSRSRSESKEIVGEALKVVFRVRQLLEKSINLTIVKNVNSGQDNLPDLFAANFFGESKKQGTSLRMPLTTCKPTAMCSPLCYAHDVLDASPLSVVRGVVNGTIAEIYESGSKTTRSVVMKLLKSHIHIAVSKAAKELKNLPDGFNRRANIRFAHVGEIVCYPDFANSLAKQVRDVSKGSVDCIVYTRHPNAHELYEGLWIVNFTLDESSMDRAAWIPHWARTVYSAFGGRTSSKVEINFLEHHRWSHTAPVGKNGKICAATLPETKVRSCDAVQCKLCFEKPTQLPEKKVLP